MAWGNDPIAEQAQPAQPAGGWGQDPVANSVPSPKAGGGVTQSELTTAAGIPQDSELLQVTDYGGRIYRHSNGQLGFTSPGYSTGDQAQIERIMAGETPGDIMRTTMQEEVLQNIPVGVRAGAYAEGTPFIGSYIDEAVGALGGDDSRARFALNALREQRPGQSVGLNLLGGIAGGIGIGAAAAPAVSAAAPQTLGGQAVAGALAGGVAGAIEGGIYGYGAGDPGARGKSAATGAAIGGGAGAILGAAAPYLGSVARSAWQRVRGDDITTTAQSLGISRDAAKVFRAAMLADDIDAAVNALRNAGGDAMLADMGPSARGMADAIANSGTPAMRVLRDAVEARATQSRGNLGSILDDTFGPAQGVEGVRRGIVEGTQDARSAAYQAAYSSAIDPATPAGQAVQANLSRIPQAAVRRANELIDIEGGARIVLDANGAIAEIPNVQQIDYITRALNDVADSVDGQGKLGGQTQYGNAIRQLSRGIRDATRRAVPEYGQALDVAADTISRRNAVTAGYDALRARTSRDAVSDTLEGMSSAERQAYVQGVRSYFDDTMANVRRTITDPNVDVREAQALIRDMSSQANRDKVALILGDDAAARFFGQLDEEVVSLELRGAIARNSATAPRQAVIGAIDEIAQPGVVGSLMQGEPVNAARRIIQAISGATPEAQQLRRMGVYEDLARALTEQRGGQAVAAARMIQDAINQNAVLTEQQARAIAHVLTGVVPTASSQAQIALSRTEGLR